MRRSLLLLLLFPTVLFGAGTVARTPVRVVARVPLIAAVEGPTQVVLSPGEVARIRVRVLANVAWILGVQSPNAAVQELPPLSGPPGSANDNSRDVDIVCSSQASGPQTITLIYTLMPR